MKKTMIVGMILMVVFFIITFAGSASAQGVLHNTWFEVKVKTKTLWWQDVSIPIVSRTDSFTAYMQLEWQSENTGIHTYLGDLWTQNSAGDWENRDTMTWTVYNENDKTSLVPDFTDAVAIWYVGDDRYTTNASFRLKISTDTTGLLKKATFISMGCNVDIALSAGDATGGCTIKGKSLKEAPFNR